MSSSNNRNQFRLLIALIAWVWLCTNQVNAGEVVVAQKDRLFQIDDKPATVLTARVGDTIKFRNDDSYFHNVYSVSETQAFDLGSYPLGFHRSVALTTPGAVDVECALHSTMRILINVAP